VVEESQETPAPPPVIRPRWRRLGIFVSVCCWFYLLLVLGLWALLREADRWWPATFLMFSPRGLFLFPLALLYPAALALRRRAVRVLLLGTVVAAGPLMGLCVPWQTLWSTPPRGPSVRVLTCNMHYKDQDKDRLDLLINEVNPDIVALQEWSRTGRSALLQAPEWHMQRLPGLCLASRRPIRRAERLGTDSMDDKGSVMRYEVDTPAGPVTFFNLHFATPREDLHGVLHDQPSGAADLDANSATRALQSAHVAGLALDCVGPVLIAGDFNTPPESVLFRRVWAPFTDAFGTAGFGWGYTFINNRTTVRIDHILAGPGWRCVRCWVGPSVGSQHRPVIADLVLAPDAR
jgi:vancomycin resistance protein VanJ